MKLYLQFSDRRIVMSIYVPEYKSKAFELRLIGALPYEVLIRMTKNDCFCSNNKELLVSNIYLFFIKITLKRMYSIQSPFIVNDFASLEQLGKCISLHSVTIRHCLAELVPLDNVTKVLEGLRLSIQELIIVGYRITDDVVCVLPQNEISISIYHLQNSVSKNDQRNGN